MKKILTFLFLGLICLTSNAQVSKTIHLATAGTLKDQNFSPATAKTITNFTLTGNIDARDFQFMRDSMNVLMELDLSGANIVAYSGSGGTYRYSTSYPANELPQYSFYNGSTRQGKTSLTAIYLPGNLTSIGGYAFGGCSSLTEITIH